MYYITVVFTALRRQQWGRNKYKLSRKMNKLLLFSISVLLTIGCKKAGENKASADGTTTNDFSALYAKMYNIVSIDTSNSKTVTIVTLDMPDHKTPFYGIGHPKYVAYNGDNPGFDTLINLSGTLCNPKIRQQYIKFVLPRSPKLSADHASTSGRPMGIARNGVVFFNQYENDGLTLGDLEMNNVDQFLGHPTATSGQYHYHFEPKYLTAQYGTMGFMGFLLDGFPVYGPYENGDWVKSGALDKYNGHVGPTVDYPDEQIYHYHVIPVSSGAPAVLKKAAPYINGGNYYGVVGSVN
jgi:hypothetical protein